MFQYEEVVGAVKALASNDHTPFKPHCQLLEFYAKRLGYQNYHHLQTSLKHLPIDQFGNISLKLMRQICLQRLPIAGRPYYEFQSISVRSISYYSQWIGWDKQGKEVRVPRALDGRPSVKGLRDTVVFPVYVIESERELLAWRYNWRSTALLPETLAKRFFTSCFNKNHLVAEDPPLSLIRAK